MRQLKRPISPASRWLNPSAFVLVLLLMLALVSCEALGGNPNTSAPSASNETEFWNACQERQSAIDDWEKREDRKIEDDLADGKITFGGAFIKTGRVDEDAEAMREELLVNCQQKAYEEFGP